MFRIFGAKCRAHPENEVGLMVMGGKGSVRPSSPLLSYLCTGQHTPVATIFCPLDRGHAVQQVLEEAECPWWG